MSIRITLNEDQEKFYIREAKRRGISVDELGPIAANACISRLKATSKYGMKKASETGSKPKASKPKASKPKAKKAANAKAVVKPKPKPKAKAAFKLLLKGKPGMLKAKPRILTVPKSKFIEPVSIEPVVGPGSDGTGTDSTGTDSTGTNE